ncbi:hypothetical protein JCM10369A_24300 [Nocardioides pyridinolyticus]
MGENRPVGRSAPDRAPSVRTMGSQVRWLGVRGLALVGCAVLIGAVLNWPSVPLTRWRYASGQTIYPWWTWLLVAAVAAAGAVLVVAPDGPAGRRWRSGAAGVALVAAAQLTGTGAVAARHWKPAQGMGGYPGETRVLQALAVLLAATALVAVGVAVAQLVLDRVIGRKAPRARSVLLVAGVAVTSLLPLLMLDGHERAVTTWGAVGLLYAGPWGLAIVASAWLEWVPATVVLAAVAGCASLASVGPHMSDLLLADDARLATVALLAGLLALGVGRTGRSHDP